MVQVSERVGVAMKGSMKAVAGSGMANMSLASIDFQPRIEEPSKPRPSLKESSDSSLIGKVKCCQVPKVSTNFTSTILAPCFRASSNTCLGLPRGRFRSTVFFIWFTDKNSPRRNHTRRGKINLNCLFSGFLGADTDGIFDGTDEDLAVTDLAGLGGFDDGRNGICNQVVRQNNFDFELRKKIDGVFASAINLGVPFLATKPFDFRDRHAFHADAGEGFLHVFQLERLDDRLDSFHARFRSRRRY